MLRRFTECWSGSVRVLPHVWASRLRAYTTEPDHRFIILNPRQAGIVRRPRRRGPKNIETLNELQPPPLEPQLPQQISIVTEIHAHRPESQVITAQRYAQLRTELKRGFKKEQLVEYLSSQGIKSPRSSTKQKLVTQILNNAWSCAVRKEGESALVDNSLDLSERDFVLLLGGQGRLLREWSKSGARISLLPARCQIQVQSRQETFDWISASLSKFLETVIATEIDVSEFKTLVNPLADQNVVAAIQQLTDTYFANKNADADSITVFSAGHNKYANSTLVKRLLLHLANPAIAEKWRPATWSYDANPSNHASYYLHPFDETDSMEWIDRLQSWMRWEAVKSKTSSTVVGNIELKELETPRFDDSNFSSTVDNGGELEEQVLAITRNLIRRHPAPEAPLGGPVSTTLSITPGYVLHAAGGDTSLPHAGMPKIFNSNIPYVSALASTLPMYAKDVHQEDTLETEGAQNRDLWMEILNLGNDKAPNSTQPFDSEKRVYTARRKDLRLASNLRLIQLKFVANPSQGHALKYPPVEAWAVMPDPGPSSSAQLTEAPRLMAVPVEAAAHISLPTLNSDLKVTLAHAYPVPVTKEIETFFTKKCYFGRLGPLRVERELTINMDGQPVSYLYHSSVYVTLAELELNKSLLHLSQVEGGKLGGRKVEASLVSHAESAEEFNIASADAMVRNALDFVKNCK